MATMAGDQLIAPFFFYIEFIPGKKPYFQKNILSTTIRVQAVNILVERIWNKDQKPDNRDANKNGVFLFWEIKERINQTAIIPEWQYRWINSKIYSTTSLQHNAEVGPGITMIFMVLKSKINTSQFIFYFISGVRPNKPSALTSFRLKARIKVDYGSMARSFYIKTLKSNCPADFCYI